MCQGTEFGELGGGLGLGGGGGGGGGGDVTLGCVTGNGDEGRGSTSSTGGGSEALGREELVHAERQLRRRPPLRHRRGRRCSVQRAVRRAWPERGGSGDVGRVQHHLETALHEVSQQKK
jgi:hypothetical protein